MWPFNCFQKKVPELLELKLQIEWSTGIAEDGYAMTARPGQESIATAHSAYDAKGSFRLTKIDVTRDHRGKKYGPRMIRALMQAAKSKQCTEFIFQGVDNSNTRAIKRSTGPQFKAQPVLPPKSPDKTAYQIVF